MFLSNTNIDATGLKPRFELDLNYPQRLDSDYPLDYPDSNCTRTQSKEFLDIQETIECIFTLKRVRDMTRIYRQI